MGRGRKRILSIGLPVAACVIAPLFWLRFRGMPNEALDALKNAETFELISLNPMLTRAISAQADTYHNFLTIGSTLIDDPIARKKLIGALQASAQESDGNSSSCFNPRHAIRVTRAGMVTDFLICFECRHVQVWRDKKMISHFTITSDPQITFNEQLTSAGIALKPPTSAMSPDRNFTLSTELNPDKQDTQHAHQLIIEIRDAAGRSIYHDWGPVTEPGEWFVRWASLEDAVVTVSGDDLHLLRQPDGSWKRYERWEAIKMHLED